jgi:hypothetical protein
LSYDQQGRRVLQDRPSRREDECKALHEQNTELALQVLASEGQAVEAYAEAKALRARVQELEAALREISTYASSGMAWEPDSCGMCENTLDTASAALQKQEGGANEV